MKIMHLLNKGLDSSKEKLDWYAREHYYLLDLATGKKEIGHQRKEDGAAKC